MTKKLKENKDICAFDKNRECKEDCVANASREKGNVAWYRFCERGNFWIGGLYKRHTLHLHGDKIREKDPELDKIIKALDEKYSSDTETDGQVDG